uniref:glycerophosphodiester phosphodiesterase family protein n=1 Tax=Altererythrobacter segetis TaxID=1104773 RepID=UPI00140957D7|nr:glycerophosphodiester phosphodiesterase family protein [Altererythrobacter segetis]
MPWAALDGWLSPAPDPARIGWLKGRDYAHRGLHGGEAPENSLSAFSAAISHGMGIECDVQQTSDGRAMVFHDRDLDRLTGESGPVAGRSAAALAQIALGGGNDRIPRLSDFLGMIRGQVPLLIEIKTRRERRVAALCLAVRRDVEGYRGPVAVMSFDPRVGGWFRRHAPHIVRGLVVTEEGARTFSGSVRRRLALWQAGPDFLAYDVRDLPSSFAAAQRRRGLPVLTWTVRSAALRERAMQCADAPIVEGEGVAENGKNL